MQRELAKLDARVTCKTFARVINCRNLKSNEKSKELVKFEIFIEISVTYRVYLYLKTHSQEDRPFEVQGV